MFSFLNPIILIGLAAAAIPILIHLLTRSKVKTVYFSTLTFLKELQRQKIRRLKLRQILLLILRTLILILLVMAFARPTARRVAYGGRGPSVAQSSMVMILDNSASMGREMAGRRLYDSAVDRALEDVDLLAEGGDARLILPEVPPRLVHREVLHDPDRLSQAITEQGLSYSSTDLSGAIEMATDLLGQSDNVNREIYIISDLQATAFAPFSGDSVEIGSYRLFVLPTQVVEYDNLGIEQVEVGSQIIEKGRPTQIKARVRNYGTRSQRNRLVQLFVEGKRAAQSTVSLESDESREVIFIIVPKVSGLLSGSVIVEDEGQHEDDERYFVLRVPEQIEVLLAAEGPEAARIRFALNPMAATESLCRITSASGSNLAGELLLNYNVLILCNISLLDDRGTRAVRAFVERGGGLLLIPGSRSDLRFFNNVLCPTLRLPLFVESLGQIGEQTAIFEFGKMDYRHPIFYGVFEEKQHQVRSPKFHFALKIKSSDIDRQNIIEFSTGDPFLYETKLDRGRVLVFTSGLEESWSSFSTATLFAPLMSRCVRYLASSGLQQHEELLVGEGIQKRLRSGALGASFEMSTPDRRQVALLPKELGDAYVVEFQDASTPGIYTLTSDGQEVDRWAVNVDPRESQTQPIENVELKKKYPSLIYVQPDEELRRQVEAVRLGREFWKPLAAAVLVLLIVEMALYREREEVVDEPRRGEVKV